MTESRTGQFALAFFTLGSLFIIVAFVSPHWLVNDGKLKDPKFKKLGKAGYLTLVFIVFIVRN